MIRPARREKVKKLQQIIDFAATRLLPLAPLRYKLPPTSSLVSPQWTQKVQIEQPGTGFHTAEGMIDTGCGPMSVISPRAVKRMKLHLVDLETPCFLEGADGGEISEVRQAARLILKVGRHIEELFAFVADIAHYDIILGKLWMQLHDVHLHSGSQHLHFESDHCVSTCLIGHTPLTINRHGCEVHRDPPKSTADITIVSAEAFVKLAQSRG